MVTRADIPRYVALYLPVLRALDRFNGSATSRQIVDEVVEQLDSGVELVLFEYPNRSKSILEDRIAWATSYCYLAGLARRPSRGLYVLTQEGRTLLRLPFAEAQGRIAEINAGVRAQRRLERQQRRAEQQVDDETDPDDPFDHSPDVDDGDDETQPSGEDAWRDPLLEQIHSLSDEAFERLVQVVLQSYGLELEHTGGPGDQGIDCLGIAPVSAVMSATVAVQAKRREPTARVARGDVALLQRDAANAGAERAIMVTSGDFSQPARRAARETTPTVHLINGNGLCDLMREQEIGVSLAPQPDLGFFADLETQTGRPH